MNCLQFSGVTCHYSSFEFSPTIKMILSSQAEQNQAAGGSWPSFDLYHPDRGEAWFNGALPEHSLIVACLLDDESSEGKDGVFMV